MTSAELSELRRTLIEAEDLRLKPYVDTAGKITIGVGRNLTDRGLSKEEALLLLENDLSATVHECERTFAWFHALDAVRQRALAELAFNLGMPELLQFRRALAAMARGDFETAANEFKDSLWYRQVKRRGVRIVQMIRMGQEPMKG